MGARPASADLQAGLLLHAVCRLRSLTLTLTLTLVLTLTLTLTFKQAYCCTQFAVSAARIRLRSHLFWRSLLADLLDPEVPEVCKISGHMLELFWGYLLGEPADFKCRDDLWGHRGPPPHADPVSASPTAPQAAQPRARPRRRGRGHPHRGKQHAESAQ